MDSLKGKTPGEDLYNHVSVVIVSIKLPWSKLSRIKRKTLTRMLFSFTESFIRKCMTCNGFYMSFILVHTKHSIHLFLAQPFYQILEPIVAHKSKGLPTPGLGHIVGFSCKLPI